jgi:hypothetical protein
VVDYILQEAESPKFSQVEFREVLRLMAKDIELGSFPY